MAKQLTENALFKMKQISFQEIDASYVDVTKQVKSSLNQTTPIQMFQVLFRPYYNSGP